MLAGLGGLAACKDRSEAAAPVHTKANTPALLGQAVLRCDDGGSVDVDFLDQGLRMAVTWLPGGPTEQLRAPATGRPFVGARTRATIVGGTTAFEQAGGSVRICHRPS